MDYTVTRRPCFIEEDDGLASLTESEAGISGNNHHFFSRPLYYSASQSRRSGSMKSLSAFSSVSCPRSGRFCDGRLYEEHQPHFLEACFLCNKPLGDNKDIFMYRGDIPFCSEECRQEQIEMDDAKEKNSNSASKKFLRKDQKKSTSPKRTKDYTFRTGTIVAA